MLLLAVDFCGDAKLVRAAPPPKPAPYPKPAPKLPKPDPELKKDRPVLPSVAKPLVGPAL